jgi:hypothetical protein
VDDELFARSEFTFEAAVNFGNIDADRAGENAVLGNLNDPAVHRGFDTAFNDQRVAVGNLGTFEFDVGAHDELAAFSGIDSGQWFASIRGQTVGMWRFGRILPARCTQTRGQIDRVLVVFMVFAGLSFFFVEYSIASKHTFSSREWQ